MEQQTRNTLRRTVEKARRLLENSIGEQLEGIYGILPTGTVQDESDLKELDEEDLAFRRELKARLKHIQAHSFKPRDAVLQLVREIGFTHLNRLVAYKLMAARELIRDPVSKVTDSVGYQMYLADHPESESLHDQGAQDEAYRRFLVWQGEQFSDEIPALFDVGDPANRLFPKHRHLIELLDLLNDPELANIWDSDETIGWVYQYYTPKELREKARKESAAPRNSYELAFRNQFYTPRYVVEFLADNTLGRTWYEMQRGETRLKEKCDYLVYRPNERFLGEGEETTEESDVRHRAKKDPRELRILDPACGSGHFLLYCFNLLQTIYEEAYEDPVLGPLLKEDYESFDALRRDVPRLIIEHNLHGVDIDARAIQIAALALWLRAQRAFNELKVNGVNGAQRPRITRGNLVVAEPMPGERELLDDFVSGLRPKVLGELVRTVFEKMQLAGEAGTLLRIEEEIEKAVAAEREQWSPGKFIAQTTLVEQPAGRGKGWSGQILEAEQKRFEIAGDVKDASFWDEAEERLLFELKRYAERAQSDGKNLARLFAEDAARGFAFIDLCQKRFDVILMNPPFGDPSKPSKAYVTKAWPRTKNDVYATFVEMGIRRCVRYGMVGAITSRSGFFLTTFQKWREQVLMGDSRTTVMADLGGGVLDTAMVETAAYCQEKIR